MKFFRSTLLSLSFPVAIYASPPADWQAAIDAWRAGGTPGVAAAWIDRDGVVFANSGRVSAMDDAQPVTAESVFELGSVTKVFTGALLAVALHDGVVRLDDAVNFASVPGALTYRQLATHTAGLPTMPRLRPESPRGPASFDEVVASFAEFAPAARPGAVNYSNLGYAVLGHAVAGVRGEEFAAAVQARLLGPLSMTQTWLDWRSAPAGLLVSGHRGGRSVPHLDFRGEAPAGGLVAGTQDLAKFVAALLADNDAALHAALRRGLDAHADGPDAATKMGLGWRIERRGHATIAWVAGGTAGCRSFIALDRTRGVGIVLLGNDGARALEPLGFQLLAAGK